MKIRTRGKVATLYNDLYAIFVNLLAMIVDIVVILINLKVL